MKQLTPNQSSIMDLVCEGYTFPEIAEKKIIGLGTVKSTMFRIYTNLGARNVANAVSIYLTDKFNTQGVKNETTKTT